MSGIQDYEDDIIEAGTDATLMHVVMKEYFEYWASFSRVGFDQEYLDAIGDQLASLGVQRFWNDSSMEYAEIDEYRVVGSRYANSRDVGKLVRETFDDW